MMGLAGFWLVGLAIAAPPDSKADAVLKKFYAAWNNVQTLSYRFEKHERMRDGRLIHEETNVKFRKPDSVYLEALVPARGQEVIFDGRRNPRQLTVHPGHFPDFTLHLDVHGSLTTKDQHHPVYRSGFGYVALQLRRAQKRAKEGDGTLTFAREDVVAGRRVAVVRLTAGSKPPRSVVVPRDMSLFAFADENEADSYGIFMLNPQLDAVSDDLEQGMSLLVPNYYSASAEFWFDLENGLAIQQISWNDKNELYEKYIFHKLVVNPAFTDLDFDPDNPAYKF